MVMELTEDNFDATLNQAEVPVLVDFWAPWCGPCRAVAPVMEELAIEYSGKLEIYKLNVDETPSIPEKFQIRSIPTLILFKDAVPVERITGALPKGHLQNMLNKALGQ